VKVLLAIVVAGIAAMWVYGFFFAPKRAANRIDDTRWTEAAEAICASTRSALLELPTARELQKVEPFEEALRRRVAALDEANALLRRMYDDIVALPPPTDARGRAIVPQWLADYDQYIEDRVVHTDEFRAGRDVPFAETAQDGIPASERIDAFARDNAMESCKVPLDI
jgi:hypothetical protein